MIMEIYSFSDTKKIENTVLCLGDFDGVHKGHRKIFEMAKNEGRWGVLLFRKNSKNEPNLTTFEEKIEILENIGASYIIAVDFERDIKHQSPVGFVDYLKKLQISGVAVGYDYRFGYKAVGDVTLLKSLCKERNIRVYVADAVAEQNEPIKSTKIRELVKKGDLINAKKLLGEPYIISGEVVGGLENGRKMGIPTANIDVSEDKLLPSDGVYKGSVGKVPAVINVGLNPTFDAKKRTVEAHLLGFEGDLYGKSITICLTEKIRDEIKFDNKDELIRQIKKDIEYAMGGNKNG